MWDMMVKRLPKMGFGGLPKMGIGGAVKGAMPGAIQAAPMIQSELKGGMPGAMQATPMMQSELAAPRAALPQGPISEEMLASRYGGQMKSMSPWGGLLSKR